jgi:Flp pilus assembly protein CpaB
VVSVVVATTALMVHQRGAQADRTKTEWGITINVLVARHDISAGATVAVVDVERRALPAAMVPDGAVGELEAGSVVAHTIIGGEVVMRQRLAPSGSGPIAAQLGPDEVGIAVPTGPARPAVEVGDGVELFGVSGRDGAGGGSRAVARGRVVAIGEEQVTVAIPESQATALASAQATAPVMIAVRPHR